VLAVGLALVAAASWGCGDFLGGLSSRRVPMLTVLAVSEVAGLVAIVAVLAVVGPARPGAGALAWAAAAGIAGSTGLGALYRGMAVGAMGVVAPLSSAAAIVPVAFGVATGERPDTLQVAGVACALAGVVLASREPSAEGVRRAAGVELALVAAGGFGLYFVFIDRASEGGALWATTVSRGTASVLAVGAALALGSLRVPGRLAPRLVLVGLFDVGANGMLTVALRHGLVSLVSVLSSLYPVVTVLLARLTLQERTARTQQIGVVLALGGAALIAAG
jgi:drug/metabolite transporter (DMT)-like permease